jgi:hypothetical protein
MGPLFTRILVDQFTRLGDGDRFFYLNETFTPDALSIIRQGSTLAKVIESNTNITNLQCDVFLFRASISGTVSVGSGMCHTGSFGTQVLAGVTVELEDTSGNVLATTVTNAIGRYEFNQFTGIGSTGEYEVRVVVPSGYTQTSANPATLLLSRGAVHDGAVDFHLAHRSTARQTLSAATAPKTDFNSLDMATIDTVLEAINKRK